MVNIKTEFLREYTDQVISANKLDGDMKVRAPGPGLKLGEMDIASSKQQASSAKPQAPSESSNKPQASSPKQQASSSKPQASSS
jgi:Tfp pilus assembly protein PilX